MRENIVNSIKAFCISNKLTYLYDIVVGPKLLITIKEPTCIEALDTYLTAQGFIHTAPCPSELSDGVECYIECPEPFIQLINDLRI